MCTLTWLHEPDGSYCVLFNRDELKTRQRALPPALKTHSGVSYLAPTDSDAGGTWLAVNQFGLTVCLLNDYLAPEPATDTIHSRGEVVTALADCSSVTQLEARLQAMDLHFYKGFELVVFQDVVRHWRWNVQVLSSLDATVPITSSSYETKGVQKIRTDYFNSLKNTRDLATLEHFHSSHIDDELQELDGMPIAVNSVCMHRSYAETVSQCLVQVNPATVSLTYTDGAPCRAVGGEPLSLNRLAVA